MIPTQRIVTQYPLTEGCIQGCAVFMILFYPSTIFLNNFNFHAYKRLNDMPSIAIPRLIADLIKYVYTTNDVNYSLYKVINTGARMNVLGIPKSE